MVHKHAYFDGIISLSFGIRFPTLQTKVKRLYKKHISASVLATSGSKKQRCQQLFRHMAEHAKGDHRKILIRHAENPGGQSYTLLEELYLRLLANEQVSSSCPSRYIHSSPVVALKILKEIFG